MKADSPNKETTTGRTLKEMEHQSNINLDQATLPCVSFIDVFGIIYYVALVERFDHPGTIIPIISP